MSSQRQVQAAVAATEASRVIRERRRMLRAYVEEHDHLSLTIREHGTALRGMRLAELLTWMPGVGRVKANYLLRGLPSEARLGELTTEQHALFLLRITTFERKHPHE